MAVHEAGNATLGIWNGTTYDVVSQISDITAPEKTLNIITDHFIGSDEPTKTPTNFDYGAATFTLAYDPDNTQHVQLETDQAAKTDQKFEIIVSSATLASLEFTGYITSVGAPTTSGGDKLTTSVTIDVTTVTDWAV